MALHRQLIPFLGRSVRLPAPPPVPLCLSPLAVILHVVLPEPPGQVWASSRESDVRNGDWALVTSPCGQQYVRSVLPP
jgi:hypothetical protein